MLSENVWFPCTLEAQRALSDLWYILSGLVSAHKVMKYLAIRS